MKAKKNMINEFYIPEYPEQIKSVIRQGRLSSFRLFRSWGVLVSQMTDEEAGQAFKKLFEYMQGERMNFDDTDGKQKAFLLMAFRSVEDSITREIERAINLWR